MSHIATILLLGSGELGREFVISAKRLGARVIACDSYDDAPAMQLADAREVFAMLDGAALRAAVEKHRPDLIVPEIGRSAPRCWPIWRLRALPSCHPRARRSSP
jgi:phosphoribosylglycinamide formyltransferase 2